MIWIVCKKKKVEENQEEWSKCSILSISSTLISLYFSLVMIRFVNFLLKWETDHKGLAFSLLSCNPVHA